MAPPHAREELALNAESTRTRAVRPDPSSSSSREADPSPELAWRSSNSILSCGHASMLLYSLLHLSGYDLPLQEIMNFRQWGSLTPAHPKRGHTPGVETTTAAPAQLDALAQAGIDLQTVTRELEAEGVAKFAASYAAVLAGIDAKAGALAAR